MQPWITPVVAAVAFGLGLGVGLGLAGDEEPDPGEARAAGVSAEPQGRAAPSYAAADDGDEPELRVPEDEAKRTPVEPETLEDLDEQVRRELEQELVAELAAGLGPEWSSEIPPPSHGEGPMVGGVRHGEWEIQHPKSGTIERGHFLLGARYGTSKLYDAVDGTLVRVSHYVGGKLHGPMQDRMGDKDGPWRYFEYDMGQLVTD